VALGRWVALLPGIGERVLIDIGGKLPAVIGSLTVQLPAVWLLLG
jgi:hypothetical protein